MKIRLVNNLPIISFSLTYHGQTIFMDDVLLDTGCAVSVFDTDLAAKVGLTPTPFSTIVRMYGIGGRSDFCLEQVIEEIMIDNSLLRYWPIQLGAIKNEYGFEAILGIDFMCQIGLVLDCSNLTILRRL